MTGRPMQGFARLLAGSILLHAALLLLAAFVFNAGPRIFINPVYTVELVQGQGQRKAKAAEKSAPEPLAQPPRKEEAAPEPAAAAPPPKEQARAEQKKSSPDAVKIKGKQEPRQASVDDALKSISRSVEQRKDGALVDASIDELRRKVEADRQRSERLASLRQDIGSREAASAADLAGQAQKAPEAASSAPSGKPNLQDRFPAYFGIIKERVQRNWVYPQGLKDSRISVIVSIKIARSGKLVEASVEKSSGNQAFDESLLSAVWKASPFPELPVALEGSFLETGLRFCPGCVE